MPAKIPYLQSGGGQGGLMQAIVALLSQQGQQNQPTYYPLPSTSSPAGASPSVAPSSPYYSGASNAGYGGQTVNTLDTGPLTPGTVPPGFQGYASGGKLMKRGGKVSKPTAIVGEGDYPEYVIPTDPKYRGRAKKLMKSAKKDMEETETSPDSEMSEYACGGKMYECGGVMHMASGGVLDQFYTDIGGPLPQSGSPASGSSVQDLIANYQNAYEQAKSVNEARYAQILKGYTDRSKALAGYLDVLGQNQRDETGQYYAQKSAGEEQSLRERGLNNATIRNSVLGGVEAQKQQTLRRMSNDTQTQQLGLYGKTTGDTLGFMERRQDPYPSYDVLAKLLAQLAQSDAIKSAYTSLGGR